MPTLRIILGLWLLLAACAASAADLSGIWVGQIPGRNGESQDIAIQLEHNGTQLKGKLYGDYLSTPIEEGLASGDLVTFIVLVQEQAGNEINDTRVRFTGRLKDGQLELFRERESSTRAGALSGAHIRDQETKQSFSLKRLI